MHLLDDDLGEPLELPTGVIEGSDGGRVPPAETDLDEPKSSAWERAR